MRTIRFSFVLACIVALGWGCAAEVLGGGGGVDAGDDDAPDRPDAWVAGDCEPQTCEELGWACGQFETCGEVVDCADVGRTCGEGEVCIGGYDGPTECVRGGEECEVCSAIPDCSGEAQVTTLSGRVVTPGRSAGDTGNQVGVPNAVVYIPSFRNLDDLPEIPTGLPAGGASCERCEDQGDQLGPFVAAAVTDAAGFFELEEAIPVGEEILLVVKAGKFRRATRLTLPAEDACTDIAMPEQPSGDPASDNPTRLPRDMEDGLAVHMPRIAVTTGVIDAMECVLEKIGIDHREFDNPGSDARIHLYQGVGEDVREDHDDVRGGMLIDDQTPEDSALYGDPNALEGYDMVVSDCKGLTWDSDFSDRDAFGANVRDYVNRGGRMFASHLSFSWLHENGDLGSAATFQEQTVGLDDTGIGEIARNRPLSSPRIDSFRDWMVHEEVVTASELAFPIRHPRSQATGLGSDSEEFVFCTEGDCTHETQQFSFNTPYGAPAQDACGRVAYSGFHVSPAPGEAPGSFPYEDREFPELCGGDLTDQEKVLLYMIFDLAACIGEPVPPTCRPRTCADSTKCGLLPDGCGGLIDCDICTVD